MELALPLMIAILAGYGAMFKWVQWKDQKLQECMEARLDDLKDRVAHHEAAEAAIIEARKANGDADKES